MVLIRVDLPEPDGPHTTTTSPLAMLVVQLLSTCTEPYHLDTSFSSIIFISFAPVAKRTQRMMAMRLLSRLTSQDRL